jgi:lipopolysaccharide assembly outer membrane protein LptD (OstA)
VLDGSGKYVIEADLSELNYIGDIETVFMSNVTAEIIDTNNNKIIIVSDDAVFNTVTYNTTFKNNISINYLQNMITSDKIDFNFKKNIIIISENIIYKNLNTFIKTDNIKINLITKKIKMYMNDPEDKIELTTQK